jgi:hypothetical protein
LNTVKMIVERLLASGKPVLVVGGDHDLMDNLERIGGGAEYVRVQVQAHREADGE